MVLDYGLRLASLTFTTSAGIKQQLVLGGWPLADYEKDQAYHGAVIGRTCNRIAAGDLKISGISYQLDRNEGDNHLHGGVNGLHNRVWQVESTSNGLHARTVLADGESGYPGNVDLEVQITLAEAVLHYRYSAVSDRDTVLDLTNHAYFCLDDSRSILQHELQIPALKFAPIDRQLLPTGALQSVYGTPFDLTRTVSIGQQLAGRHEQLDCASGFDHSWLLSGDHDNVAARLFSPRSGFELLVTTSSPAIQVYTGNHLPIAHSGICLETQHLPDACHHPDFQEPILKAGETFSAWSSYGLSDYGGQAT